MQFFDELPRAKTQREARVDWEKLKAELIENEGRWGLMAANISNSTPQQLRTGKYKAFKQEDLEHFEFAVRKPKNPAEHYGPRMTDLYGRYTKKSSE